MTLDLEDMPPRIAAQLEALSAGEELILVRGGAVVARLRAAEKPARPPEDLPPEGMKEVMEHFEAMIEDQF